MNSANKEMGNYEEGYIEEELEKIDSRMTCEYARNYLADYKHLDSRGDSRRYFPKEGSRAWIGNSQDEFFVTYSIPEGGGRTAVASVWVEDKSGNQTIRHFDLGKLLTPILKYHIRPDYMPAKHREDSDRF